MANPGPASSIQTHPQVLSSNQALRLLGSAQSINCNATGDTAIPILNTSSYIILYVIATNASISLTTAAGGLFTGTAAGGTPLVTSAALSVLTSSTVASQRTVLAAGAAQNTSQTIYWNIATAQGAAATMDLLVYGIDLTFLP